MLFLFLFFRFFLTVDDLLIESFAIASLKLVAIVSLLIEELSIDDERVKYKHNTIATRIINIAIIPRRSPAVNLSQDLFIVNER